MNAYEIERAAFKSPEFAEESATYITEYALVVFSVEVTHATCIMILECRKAFRSNKITALEMRAMLEAIEILDI